MVRTSESGSGPGERAAGPAAHLGLSDAALLDMYYKLLVSRIIGERMFVLNRQGKAPFAITGQGQEACQVGSAYAIEAGVDWALPYYRDIGVVLTLGMTAREIMLGFFARADDPSSGGRQMPSHWSKPEARIVSHSSPVTTQFLHAAGIAYASKVRGLKEVTITYCGEGSTSQGDFHEALNFAGIHHLPVVFFVENNGYAITEPQAKEMAVLHVADRARAYGFRGQVVDGNDVLATYQTTKWAVDEARRGRGPALIEAKTYRIVPHSSDDDDRRYRSREELEEWARKDPIDRFKNWLQRENLLAPEKDEAMRAQASAEVQEAIDFAERSPLPDPATAMRYVYAEE
jgi:2-oxoisovalerate dehydrogenase E1 component alpha subunit